MFKEQGLFKPCLKVKHYGAEKGRKKEKQKPAGKKTPPQHRDYAGIYGMPDQRIGAFYDYCLPFYKGGSTRPVGSKGYARPYGKKKTGGYEGNPENLYRVFRKTMQRHLCQEMIAYELSNRSRYKNHCGRIQIPAPLSLFLLRRGMSKIRGKPEGKKCGPEDKERQYIPWHMSVSSSSAFTLRRSRRSYIYCHSRSLLKR